MGNNPNLEPPDPETEQPEQQPEDDLPDPDPQILERGIPPDDIEKRDK